MDGGHIVGDLVDTCVVAGIKTHQKAGIINVWKIFQYCLLYTSDAADD